MKRYLIITSALHTEEFGVLTEDELTVRIADYQSSFYHALKFKNDFDAITILECISKNRIPELEESGISVYYSKLGNDRNKGTNEILHLWDFINQEARIDEGDIIIKLTGRYILQNANILSYFKENIDFVGKDSSDIYKDSSIHGFFFGARKRYFREIYEHINPIGKAHSESELKKLATLEKNKDKTIILNEKIGVIMNARMNQGNSPKPLNHLKLYL